MVCWECWWRDENGTGLDGLENHPVGEQEMASITSPMAANYKLLKLWSCNSWVLARIQLEWCLAFQVKYQVKGCPSFEAYTPCLPLGANQHCRSSSCKQHTMRPHGPQKRQATQPNILRPDDQQQQTKKKRKIRLLSQPTTHKNKQQKQKNTNRRRLFFWVGKWCRPLEQAASKGVQPNLKPTATEWRSKSSPAGFSVGKRWRLTARKIPV